MDSNNIFLLNLSKLFDFSSITFALIKQYEESENRNSNINFGDLNLNDFRMTNFEDLFDKFSKNDNKIKEELKQFFLNSELYKCVKPKLILLSQIYFLINQNLIDKNNFFIFFEDEKFIEFLGNDYLNEFKNITNINNIIFIDDLIKKISDNKNKKFYIENEKFLNEKIKSLNNLNLINEKEFEKFLESNFNKEVKSNYSEFIKNEFIIKYQKEDINKKFKFFSLWKNYIFYKEKILIEGKIVSGFQRGSKQLGIPTANIEMTEENSKKIKKLINGTLFGRMSFKTNKKNNKNIEINKTYKSVLSIGYNPTFNNQTKTIEVFLINFEGGDFYDDEVSLIIDGYSRSEMRFSGLPELVTSITYDTILFNEILENIN